jgi:hypothetical protein
MTNWHLQGCSPGCVGKGPIGWPREHVLNVPITCRWHGSHKPSSQLSTEAWLFSTVLMVGLGEKLGMDPQITQPGWGLCREPLFSGAIVLFKSVDNFTKGCYMWIMWNTYGQGPYTDRAWKAYDMLVRFFPVGCTSIWIIATLGYEKPLISWQSSRS